MELKNESKNIKTNEAGTVEWACPDDFNRSPINEEKYKELRELLIDADSKLSLLRHRGNISWDKNGMCKEQEVDDIIGKLRSAYEKDKFREVKQEEGKTFDEMNAMQKESVVGDLKNISDDYKGE